MAGASVRECVRDAPRGLREGFRFTDTEVVDDLEGQDVEELPHAPSERLAGPLGEQAELLGGEDDLLPALEDFCRELGEVGWGIDLEARRRETVGLEVGLELLRLPHDLVGKMDHRGSRRGCVRWPAAENVGKRRKRPAFGLLLAGVLQRWVRQRLETGHLW